MLISYPTNSTHITICIGPLPVFYSFCPGLYPFLYLESLLYAWEANHFVFCFTLLCPVFMSLSNYNPVLPFLLPFRVWGTSLYPTGVLCRGSIPYIYYIGPSYFCSLSLLKDFCYWDLLARGVLLNNVYFLPLASFFFGLPFFTKKCVVVFPIYWKPGQKQPSISPPS